MKKPTRTLIASSVAAALGVALLLGGAGSLAFWSDSSTSTPQTISSGTLDLGSTSEVKIGATPTIKNCTSPTSCSASGAYSGGPLVPGDVVTATVSIPVTLIGQNMKARFSVAPTKTAGAVNTTATEADTALASAMTITIKKVEQTNFAGVADAAQSVILSSTAKRDIPVTVDVSFPWGATAGQYNDAMGGKVSLGATYTLEQIPA
ncbi:alternate-type signal peptide domain-containing protein [Mycetocola manganoxydans]|uniref:Alternate-type signal peptide domain-containing protein n=1 Tax=Mycetocola manganoxydans TaxID=699879 RepID=A0A3L6ZYY3_9MICO|nr:alternate-type signal peptide domain-containing protein [Mycetocola manganoxydans]RLP72915.1 alternate-type signal peptide domain-containing protein [Mycetocola manganoxydans]GHD45005.1 hypothetical protein GCM10008097_13720 [Mycetocola manganoxydans]